MKDQKADGQIQIKTESNDGTRSPGKEDLLGIEVASKDAIEEEDLPRRLQTPRNLQRPYPFKFSTS